MASGQAGEFKSAVRMKQDVLDQARRRMRQIDEYIKGHATISSDEDNERIRGYYQEYEELLRKRDNAKREITELVDAHKEKTGQNVRITWNDDYRFTIEGLEA